MKCWLGVNSKFFQFLPTNCCKRFSKKWRTFTWEDEEVLKLGRAMVQYGKTIFSGTISFWCRMGTSSSENQKSPLRMPNDAPNKRMNGRPSPDLSWTWLYHSSITVIRQTPIFHFTGLASTVFVAVIFQGRKSSIEGTMGPLPGRECCISFDTNKY